MGSLAQVNQDGTTVTRLDNKQQDTIQSRAGFVINRTDSLKGPMCDLKAVENFDDLKRGYVIIKELFTGGTQQFSVAGVIVKSNTQVQIGPTDVFTKTATGIQFGSKTYNFATGLGTTGTANSLGTNFLVPK